MPDIKKAVVKPVVDRLSGDRPGPMRAGVTATGAGAVTAVLVYKLLR